MRVLLGTTVVAALAVSVPVGAHHSFAMFDAQTTMTLEGTISEFEFVNPHGWLHLVVTDADGNTGEWSIEMGGINAMTRNGWQADTVQPGDTISVEIHPMKDGSRGGQYLAAIFPDGRRMEGGDVGLPPIAR
jgi:hypothetical protein